MTNDDILFERRGRIGLVTLNRPKVMNALSHDMALRLDARLRDWALDADVAGVAIRGAGEKAFCAGGDIRTLYEAGRVDGRENFSFYSDEYRLNTLIKQYPKPYTALIDGVVMGGGVGVSIHGALRIAGGRTLFAMPETGIGLFPDVGGTWFLPRLPGQLGMWLGLTGARLRGADCVAAGLCDVYLPSSEHAAALTALAENPAIAPGAALAEGADWNCADAPITAMRPEIDAGFKGESLEQVLDDLTSLGSEWALKQRRIILSKSPTSLRMTFRQIRLGAASSFEECMRLEYRLARACMTGADFYEGVRAAIIDKDGAPRWRPATLAEVSEAAMTAAFAPLGDEDLDLSR